MNFEADYFLNEFHRRLIMPKCLLPLLFSENNITICLYFLIYRLPVNFSLPIFLRDP